MIYLNGVLFVPVTSMPYTVHIFVHIFDGANVVLCRLLLGYTNIIVASASEHKHFITDHYPVAEIQT